MGHTIDHPHPYRVTFSMEPTMDYLLTVTFSVEPTIVYHPHGNLILRWKQKVSSWQRASLCTPSDSGDKRKTFGVNTHL